MRDFFFKDWAWKWFSLALAIAIWFTVHRIVVESGSPKNSGNANASFSSLPVTLVSAAGDVGHYRLLQPTVSVTVSGPQDIIGRLQANPIRAFVVLANTTNPVGTEKQRVQISVPPGVTLNSLEPETIGILPPP